MNAYRSALVIVAMLATCAVALPAAAAPIRVVTAIPDFAVIAEAIGGGEVQAESIIVGNRDVHAVELLPSFFVKIRKAQMYVKVGLDLDLWSQQLIDSSRNSRLVVVDVSSHITPVEVPTFKVDASYGDLHKYGNPHYWLDPAATQPMVEAILAGLVTVAPERAATFRGNADRYLASWDQAMARWSERLAPFRGTRLVSFHRSWPYFAQRYGLEFVAELEPKPGVPPTPTHVATLQELLRSGTVAAILMESYFDDRVPTMLSRTTGVPLVQVPVLVGADPSVSDRTALFDCIVNRLVEALQRQHTGQP
ncbi:MAG: zinc ABC transporter substrate-binding protein [Thermoanaerobaculaceae bacterium]|nr:zinc ABC transporter substrate-binding protein [Thermoanaerobaculaceae bacterium]